MKCTDKTIQEQMKIHEVEIAHRKALIGFSQTDAELLIRCKGFIRDYVEDIVRVFYEKQTSFEDIDLIIGDADTLDRLKAAQKRYILTLFEGCYDTAYVNNRLRIGLVHKRIGVEARYYLSAVRVLKDILISVIRKNITDKKIFFATIDTLDKLLCFDTMLVVDTYIRSLISAVELAREKTERYALDLEEKVAERTRELRELSRKDGLTGLYNHRAFFEFLRRDLSYAKRNALPLSLVYFDVDNFKTVNDTLGHRKGDAILENIGTILSEITRDIDVACRYGGDEFCVILSGSTAGDAEKFCQRLTEKVAGTYDKITLSIGIAQTGPDEFDDSDTLIRRADGLMYEAKKEKGFQIRR